MTVSEVAPTYPVLQFGHGHLVVVRDAEQARRWTRAGMRRGWQDGLVVVDASLRRWPVTRVQARPDGVVGWITGRLVASLAYGQPDPVTLDEVRRLVLEALAHDTELWDADGLLHARRRAVDRATDVAGLVAALEDTDP